MNFKLFGGAAFALALSATVAAAMPTNILVNGSFEVPHNPLVKGDVYGLDYNQLLSNSPHWDVYKSLPGWTSVSGPGIEVHTKDTNGVKLAPAHGQYYIELDSHPSPGNSTARQSVELTAGQRYLLSFAYAPRVNPTPNTADTNAISFGVGSFFTGLVQTSGLTTTGGALMATLSPSPTAAVKQWSTVSLQFYATTDGFANLDFSAINSPETLGGFIDNVYLAPVPLPAGLVLALTGLGFAAAMRRRATAAA
jgi:hypothetical protein